MEEELARSLRFRQADNNANAGAQATQPVSMQRRSSLLSGLVNDPKRMSFDDGQMSPTSILSQSPGSFGITGGLIGGAPIFNRDRRDSLKNMVHLQDFGTD